jgi:hypothetical protein
MSSLANDDSSPLGLNDQERFSNAGISETCDFL